MSRIRAVVVSMLLATGPVAAAEEEGTRLLRHPDVCGDQIVFVYAGDLWIAGDQGGFARRLTSHEGLELFPKFSPDCRSIAFSGEYGGNRQVFVIGSDGGTPRQITWYNDVGALPPRGGFDYWVLGWSADGRNIRFRANRLPFSDRMGRYYQVPFSGGLETALPIPEGGGASWSPDGRKVAFTPIDREFRTWKRYEGGRAQDLWIYDLDTNAAEKITDWKGTDNQPVWVQKTIYFTSDRDRKLNLWAFDTVKRTARQVTRHDDYDVLWPGGDDRRVVYEAGGWIYLFDPATEKSRKVPIQVVGDFASTVPVFKNVRDRIDRFELSPSGARAVLTARGEVFTVPAKDGEIRNVTRSQGVRELDATWSPDGKWIAYLSDRTGEYEIYVRPQDGSGEERRVTTDGDVWRFPPLWSPDGERIAFADKNRRLRVAEVDTGRVHDADRGEHGDITSYAWSPDGKWLTYDKDAANRFSTVWVHSVEQKKSFALTSDLTSNFSPVFDPSGKYLYFLSNRDFNLTFSGLEFNYLYTGPTRVYVAALARETALPFVPKSDEEKAAATPESGKEGAQEASESKGDAAANAAGKKEGTGKDAEKKEAKTLPEVKIDVDGFENRVAAVPGAPGNYRALAAVKEGPTYLFGPDPESPLKRYDLKEEKEETILEGVGDYALSGDLKKVLYRKGSDFGIVDARPGQKNTDGLLKLDALTVRVEPRAEWRQMYDDAWRILRDWFYDPNLHGVDWKKMRDRYGALVPHLAHRADLDFILGELGGELNAGHVYVNAGDQPRVRRMDGGLLGAEIEADPSGRYRVAKIFPGENWHPDFRSPLTAPGVNVSVGDLILAVDGQPVTTAENFYRFLEGKAGRVVTLRVNGRPVDDGARDEKVRPIRQETNLRYLDWVLDRRRRVEEASGGRIGYLHMPNTAAEGNRELFKYFYPQATKDALIIDDRYNGGGFIPDRMIELLDRPLLNYWVRRGTGAEPTPGFSHQGPKVCLINGYSSSGGDAFPYYFRKRGLGKLIGTRTWGGLIGLSGNPGLADGGSVSVPTFRFLDTEGAWAVEGVGVAPDFEVVDRPDLVAAGRDPSLEKAIEVLLEELKANPPRRVKVPPPPIDR